MRKVKIKQLPKAKYGLGRLSNSLGMNAKELRWPVMSGEMSEPDMSVRSTLTTVDVEDANLEAEKGETAVTNLHGDGIPEQYTIGGKRHSEGGTPLNLPPNSFIFSRDKSMKIKDPEILKQFGYNSPPKGGIVPADIAKKYDINKYKKMLLDKNSDEFQRKTAESMISNFNLKLGKLALLQESIKGFPQGIPEIAFPYMEENGIDPASFLPQQAQPQIVVPQSVAPTRMQTGGSLLGEYQKPYDDLTSIFQDMSVKQAVYDNYKARVSKIKNPALRDKLLNMDNDKIFENFLQMQKQNYAMRNAGVDFTDPTDSWDKVSGNKKNSVYKNTMTNLGFDNILSTDEDIASAQAAYAAGYDVANMPQFKDKFKDFVGLTGRSDEHYIPGVSNISDIDSIYGNTTAGQLFMPRKNRQVEVLPEVKTQDAAAIQTNPLKPYVSRSNSPWWLQDIIKTTGALGDMGRVKKYLPWQAGSSTDYVDPTFVSPERELSANAEQLNIGAQGAGTFTGPQAYNSRFSQMAGQSARNAADILGRVNNTNVGIANDTERMNTDIFNKAQEKQANDATNLFDKTTIANQQFDNSKNMVRQNLRQSYIDAVTNRAQTQALNTLYPNYHVDPLSGGFVDYVSTPGTLKPSYDKNDNIGKEVAKIKQMAPGMDWDTAYKIWAADKKPDKPKAPNDDYLEALRKMLSGE